MQLIAQDQGQQAQDHQAFVSINSTSPVPSSNEVYIIDQISTVGHITRMPQMEWSALSSDHQFLHFFGILFGEGGEIPFLPRSVRDLIDEYDMGILHGIGMISLLVGAVTRGESRVILRNPTCYLSASTIPKLAVMLMEIQKLPGEYTLE